LKELILHSIDIGHVTPDLVGDDDRVGFAFLEELYDLVLLVWSVTWHRDEPPQKPEYSAVLYQCSLILDTKKAHHDHGWAFSQSMT
jgi:hypothetical protein